MCNLNKFYQCICLFARVSIQCWPPFYNLNHLIRTVIEDKEKHELYAILKFCYIYDVY